MIRPTSTATTKQPIVALPALKTCIKRWTFPSGSNALVSDFFIASIWPILPPPTLSDAFSGYGIQREQKSCIYKTTSSDYGYFTPTPHSVPSRCDWHSYHGFDNSHSRLLILRYYPLNQQFSSHLAQTGMYRNYSLNTSFDKPFCNQYWAHLTRKALNRACNSHEKSFGCSRVGKIEIKSAM